MNPSLTQCDLCKQYGDGKNYKSYGCSFGVIFKDIYKSYLKECIKEFDGPSPKRTYFVNYFHFGINFCDKCRPKIRKARRDLDKLQECKTIIYRIKKHCDEKRRKKIDSASETPT